MGIEKYNIYILYYMKTLTFHLTFEWSFWWLTFFVCFERLPHMCNINHKTLHHNYLFYLIFKLPFLLYNHLLFPWYMSFIS